MYRIISTELTDEQMEQEMRKHFDELNADVAKVIKPGRVNKTQIYAPDGTYHHIEKRSIEDFIKWEIRYFNQNVSEYGYGFETDWDEDDAMSILYKDGSIRRVDVQWDDGKTKIKTDGIDSIILDASWGSAFAGPHVVIKNYRESVAYRPEDKYGYKSVKERYDDFDDLRLDFDV